VIINLFVCPNFTSTYAIKRNCVDYFFSQRGIGLKGGVDRIYTYSCATLRHSQRCQDAIYSQRVLRCSPQHKKYSNHQKQSPFAYNGHTCVFDDPGKLQTRNINLLRCIDGGRVGLYALAAHAQHDVETVHCSSACAWTCLGATSVLCLGAFYLSSKM